LTLTTDDEYEISGADDYSQLAKVTSMWYHNGDEREPLSLLYDERAFFDHFHGRYTDIPACCLFLEKTADYTWKVRIYPIEEGATITYYYQRKITVNDTGRFSNEMVFVDEILARYYAGKEETLPLARNYLLSASAQLEEMRKGELPVVFPERKIVIPEDQEAFLDELENFRNLRKR
jgi:hypothetical protein